MLEFLSQKFNDRESLSYMWKEIEDEARAADKLKVFGTVYGSSKFNCMVFKPNGNSLKHLPEYAFVMIALLIIRLWHMKNKGMQQLHALSQNSKAIDM